MYMSITDCTAKNQDLRATPHLQRCQIATNALPFSNMVHKPTISTGTLVAELSSKLEQKFVGSRRKTLCNVVAVGSPRPTHERTHVFRVAHLRKSSTHLFDFCERAAALSTPAIGGLPNFLHDDLRFRVLATHVWVVMAPFRCILIITSADLPSPHAGGADCLRREMEGTQTRAHNRRNTYTQKL